MDIDLPSRWHLPIFLLDSAAVVAALLVAFLLHGIAMRLLRRVARRTSGEVDDLFVAHAERPLRWILVGLALASIRHHRSAGPGHRA